MARRGQEAVDLRVQADGDRSPPPGRAGAHPRGRRGQAGLRRGAAPAPREQSGQAHARQPQRRRTGGAPGEKRPPVVSIRGVSHRSPSPQVGRAAPWAPLARHGRPHAAEQAGHRVFRGSGAALRRGPAPPGCVRGAGKAHRYHDGVRVPIRRQAVVSPAVVSTPSVEGIDDRARAAACAARAGPPHAALRRRVARAGICPGASAARWCRGWPPGWSWPGRSPPRTNSSSRPSRARRSPPASTRACWGGTPGGTSPSPATGMPGPGTCRCGSSPSCPCSPGPLSSVPGVGCRRRAGGGGERVGLRGCRAPGRPGPTGDR